MQIIGYVSFACFAISMLSSCLSVFLGSRDKSNVQEALAIGWLIAAILCFK